MKTYRILSKKIFSKENYSLVPIRYKDRYNIMNWRNDQMYHLRQKNVLTKKDQDEYFNKIILPSFNNDAPDQILFSLLNNKECIGYGGLVHIDWKMKVAEISFLMKTELEKNFFEELWCVFLTMIEEIAFNYLMLKKITTFSYNLRPDLYSILFKHDFIEEKRIDNYLIHDERPVDAFVHFKETSKLSFRGIKPSDKLLMYNWVNDEEALNNSINKKPISWDQHSIWFENKIEAPDTIFYIFEYFSPVGLVRLDISSISHRISFSVDKNYRKRGIGSKMINTIINLNPNNVYSAEVLSENIASQKIFLSNKFILQEEIILNEQKLLLFKKK